MNDGHARERDLCPPRSLRQAWEAHAEEWARWARRPGHDSYWTLHRAAFLGMVPAPGRLTLDVGCGEGRVARDLAALGHRVIALDSSATLCGHAARSGGGTIVVQADAARLPLVDAAADLVVAFMSLQDMDDPASTLHEMARVVEPGGLLCLAIVHPVTSAGWFQSRADDAPFFIGHYFETGPRVGVAERDGLRMTFHQFHRPLQDYFSMLEAAGFLVESVREPTYAHGRRRRVPLFMDLRAVRATGLRLAEERANATRPRGGPRNSSTGDSLLRTIGV